MTQGLRSGSLLGYVVSLGGAAAIVGLQFMLSTVQAPFFVMFFWSLVVVRFCGSGPAFATVIFSAVAANYFLMAPIFHLTLTGQGGSYTLLYLLTGFTSVLMFASTLRYAVAQRELMQQEQKNAQRNEALAAALGNAVRARDDFLAVAGHELKTPVTALSLQAQAWLRRLAKRAQTNGADLPPLPDPTRAWQRQVLGLTRLTTLIEDLLDVSRINRRRLELNPEQLCLRAMLEDVVSRYGEVAHKAHCVVNVVASEPVWGAFDRMRVEQVFSNLLTNAIKYGAGKPITIRLRDLGEAACIEVVDGGRGIEVRDQARIFECFERATDEAHVSGLGLGLWIVRQIVEATGGTIDVTSQVGEGSTFTVRLPLVSREQVGPLVEARP